MNFKVFATLSLVAAVLVLPISVNGQSDGSDTTASTTSSSTDVTTANPCGTDGGLVSLLDQLGNLLTNLLDNVPLLAQLGLTKPGGLLDLAGFLVQVQKLLNNLLSAIQLGNLDLTSQTGLVANLLGQITTLLNNLLGGNQGTKWSCNGSGGSNGGTLGRLVNGVGTILVGSDSTKDIGLITLVNFLLMLVGQLLRALGVTGILGSLLPGGTL